MEDFLDGVFARGVIDRGISAPYDKDFLDLVDFMEDFLEGVLGWGGFD
jgi:hypothetical protein